MGSRVAVLLCVYYGKDYLREQIDSVLNQTHKDLVIWVSNDGDDPATEAILAEYQTRLLPGTLTVVAGPRKGFAANFLSLVNRGDITADYYAFCDQDDIWEPEKIERALKRLSGAAPHEPALYGGRTCLIDEEGNEIGLSPLFKKRPSFRNALVQNIAGGNTMVFNHAAKILLAGVGETKVVSHDWWAYLLISGAGGLVIYDPVPAIRYRQHDANLIGANMSSRARMARLSLLLKNRFREWSQVNIDALDAARDVLSPENRALLDTFEKLRRASFVMRFVYFTKARLYRQTFLGNMALILAVLLRKV